MFSFGSVREPLADPKSARKWLASFSSNDFLATHAAMVSELGKLTSRTAKRNLARLEAVMFLDSRSESLRRTLTAQYIDHASRSSKVENQLWQALFDLTQAFLQCYQAFARDLMAHSHNQKPHPMLTRLIARQIFHLGLDARIHLFRFEPWTPGRWVELHDLFAEACAHKLERLPLAARHENTTTIEQEYLQVLVPQAMNSGSLTPRQLEWIAQELAEWCTPLRLSVEPGSLNSFYVDLASRAGLKRRANPQALEGRALFLEMDPLHNLIMQNVVMLEEKLRSMPLSDKSPRRHEQMNLLMKLAQQVDPAFKPLARRGERTLTDGRIDAIIGFAQISAFLREQSLFPAPPKDASGSNYPDHLELSTFGHLRNPARRAHEEMQRRIDNFGSRGGWELRDRSQTGVRLVAPIDAIASVTLGTIVALKQPADSAWGLGIVRRMKRLTMERAEIGIQLIATTVTNVDLQEMKPGNGNYHVDGEDTDLGGRMFHGLYLSLKNRTLGSPIQTLILPARDYQSNKRFRLTVMTTSFPVSFGRLLEEQPEWVWSTVEPLSVASTRPLSAQA